jgi:undecaprenyl diphosphate synthase
MSDGVNVSQQSIPRHVAIVMDGNGRWAQKRFMPRFMGHKAGMDTVVKVVEAFAERGVSVLTVFAFSSENWKRPSTEVSGLMSLVLMGASLYLDKLIRMGVRIEVLGDREGLSEQLVAAWDEAERRSAHNSRITLCVAFNYGGRADVIQACRRAMAAGVSPEQLDEATLSRYLLTAHHGDPDLLIRTGGEFRISNFLLWQSAYTEFVFSDRLWPDFNASDIDAALKTFAGRERRYGGVPGAPVVAEAETR